MLRWGVTLQALGMLATVGVAGEADQPAPRILPRSPVAKRAVAVQTSASGDRLQAIAPLRLHHGRPGRGLVLEVNTSARRQVLEGIGGALTEASAYVLANLPEANRSAILDAFYGPTGARFTLGRVPMGACDFSVTGRWSYDDRPGDEALEHFSIDRDTQGFPGALTPGYGLLSLVQDALAREPRLRLVASPWTAPAWMKDNQDWYGKGKGGQLLPQHHATFARYTVKYLQAYRAHGVPIWGITPVNEPVGNGGQWESMEFTPTAMRDYLRDHLGPLLAANDLQRVKVIQFDHNRDAHALAFAEAILGDPATRSFVWGTGVHWYSATNSSETGILDRLQADHPDKALLHTEGCIDGIGTEDNAPHGAFLGWKREAWWWTPGATDWGYHWAPAAEKPNHPRYAPVHRYARDLIHGLNHWLVGWIDWNIVLDRRGGPNHVANFCAAPVMVDLATAEAYVTPLYYVMAHFSRYLDPGDQVVTVNARNARSGGRDLLVAAAIDPAGHHLKLFVFNPGPKPRSFQVQVQVQVQVGGSWGRTSIPGNALQTYLLSLPRVPGRTARRKNP